MSSSSKQQHSIIPPSLAWLTVFIPAVAYFLGSRLQDTRFSGRAMGTLVQHQLQLEEEESDAIASIDKIKSIFYIDSSTTSSTSSGIGSMTSSEDDIASDTASPPSPPNLSGTFQLKV